jgi:hypothetical protein
MVIDQRNAGASVTVTTTTNYTLDRWKTEVNQSSKFSVQQNAGSVTPPAGFANYLGATSLSAYSVGSGDYFWLEQFTEGFNTFDFNWGTANASTVTLSFWVRSSLTGTFGGSLTNNSVSRCFPFSYTISTANTWEQKSITIVGDTSGTWVGATNGNSIRLHFSLGTGSSMVGGTSAWGSTDYRGGLAGSQSVVGTNGATFYITGVQLEKGSTATSFDYRPYGTELALCQRYYYQTVQATGINTAVGSGFADSTTSAIGTINFPVTMRTNPTALVQNGTATDYDVRSSAGTVTVCSAVPALTNCNINVSTVTYTVASGLTAGQGIILRMRNNTSYLAWSAEL